MKNKKLIGLVVAFGLVAPSLIPVGQTLSVNADELDAADRCFLEFVQTDTTGETDITYTHTPLYDENLQVNGRQYDFTVDGVTGYALLTELQGGENALYEVEELFYQKQSPFEDCEGLPVYISHGLYLDYKDNAFYDVQTDTELSAETVALKAYEGFGYCGATEFVDVSETVSYATKSRTEYSIQFDLPSICGSVNGSSCANLAGAVLITYYDRFYENLIPDFQAYISIGSIIRYRTAAMEITNLIDSMRVHMGTGVEHEGTTFAEFEEGMTEYVSGQGYTYSSSSVFSWGSFDFDKYKTAVESAKPVALFLSGFTMYTGLTENGNSTDTITGDYTTSTHVEVGCGYRVDTYYNANGQVATTRKYLKVASGLISYEIGYLNISGAGQIDKAISVTIS